MTKSPNLVQSLRGAAEGGAGANLKLLLAEKALIDGSMQPAAVLVKGARIQHVKTLTSQDFHKFKAAEGQAAAQLFPEEAGCESAEVTVVDGPDLLVPAFINAHTHLAMGAMRGLTGAASFQGNVVEDLFFKLEGSLTSEDVKAFVRMGAWECLMSGVGTVWDHYYYGHAIAEALADVGLTGTVAPTLQNLAGPALVLPGCGEEDTLQTTHDIHNNLQWKEKGIVAALGPHATDTVSPALWRTIADTATALHLPIHSHVAQSIEELERSHDTHGCPPVSFLHRHGVLSAGSGWMMVHSMFVTQPELDLLLPDKHVLGFCPASSVQFGFPCDYHGWVERGLEVAVGTDCAASNDSNNVQQELRLLAAGSVFGVTRSAAFKAFERTGSIGEAEGAQGVRQAEVARNARIDQASRLTSAVWEVPGRMHSELPTGEILPGAFANLLLIRGDHPNLWPLRDALRALAFSNVAPAIDNMMVAGEWKGVRGGFHESLYSSKLYQEHREEADARFQELLSRCGLLLS